MQIWVLAKSERLIGHRAIQTTHRQNELDPGKGRRKRHSALSESTASNSSLSINLQIIKEQRLEFAGWVGSMYIAVCLTVMLWAVKVWELITEAITQERRASITPRSQADYCLNYGVCKIGLLQRCVIFKIIYLWRVANCVLLLLLFLLFSHCTWFPKAEKLSTKL